MKLVTTCQSEESERGVGVVPEDVQLTLRAVGIVVGISTYPLEDGAAAGGVGHHVVEAAACRVVEVVLLSQRHGVRPPSRRSRG